MAVCPVCQAQQTWWKVAVSSQFSGFTCPHCQTELEPDRIFSATCGACGALIFTALFVHFPLFFAFPAATLILIGGLMFHDRYLPLTKKRLR